MKLNHPNHLPPVDCPLLIDVDGDLRLAERTSYIEKRGRQMEYALLDSERQPTPETITGSFAWTYP